MTISNYLLALGLTLIVELSVAALMGYRSRVALRTVILVNLITHPALWYILWVNQYVGFMGYGSIMPILALEMLVVIVEWLLMWFALKGPAKRLLLLSLAMNAASFGAGLVLFW